MNWISSFYTNLAKPVRLALWVGLFWGTGFFAEFAFDMPSLHPLVLSLLGLAFFILIDRPFVSFGLPRVAEIWISTVLILIFAFHFSMVVIVPIMNAEEIAGLPCAPQSPEMQCYSLSKDVCSVAWTKFSKDCKGEADLRFDTKHTTRLTGPYVKKCIFKKLDQSFRSTRRMASTNGACQSLYTTDDAPTIE